MRRDYFWLEFVLIVLTFLFIGGGWVFAEKRVSDLNKQVKYLQGQRTRLDTQVETLRESVEKEYYRGVYDACTQVNRVPAAICNAAIAKMKHIHKYFELPSPGFVWPPAPVEPATPQSRPPLRGGNNA